MTLREAQFHPSQRLLQRLRVLFAAGGLLAIAGFVVNPERSWLMLLLFSYLVLGMSLAGAVFIALHYVIGAAWSTAVRRIAEAMAVLLPVGGAGILLALFLHPGIYPWLEMRDLPPFKEVWLSLGFFRARAIFYLVIWTAFVWALLTGSRRQDRDSDVAHTIRNTRLSAAFLVVFGITFWLASYDWIMSLEPDWASTLFGMYNFAGMFLAGLAVLSLLTIYLRGRQPMAAVITPQHLHDLGKLVFAFSTFWMYLWFSQYMLIWYANIPEESIYFVRRWQGAWGSLFLLNVALNWVVPFLVLLPRGNKQNPGVLAKVCLIVLAGRFLDLWLMIAPSFQPGGPQFGIPELAFLLMAAGGFGLGFFTLFGRVPAVPVGDPRLAESLHYHG